MPDTQTQAVEDSTPLLVEDWGSPEGYGQESETPTEDNNEDFSGSQEYETDAEIEPETETEPETEAMVEGPGEAAIAAARKQIELEQREALLNDPVKLREHLDGLERANTPPEAHTDEDYTAEIQKIDARYKDIPDVKGMRIPLSSLLGEQFMKDNFIDEQECAPAMVQIAFASVAPELRRMEREHAETKLALKTVLGYIVDQNQSTQQQTRDQAIVQQISKEIPDYATNPASQKQLNAAYNAVIESEAKETANRTGQSWQKVAQKLADDPTMSNILLKQAIMKLKPQGRVTRAPRGGEQTGVASRPGNGSVTQSQQKPAQYEDDNLDWV